ncbi:MAG: dTDP-4-dehydrorhamnose 3,5-epimerase [Fluviicola sp.]|jgi:dTDP-4-dehydrorhamnose 3,5-epimerase
MQCIQTDIADLLIFEPRLFSDDRGLFFESFHHQKFNEMVGRDVQFVQDNESVSKAMVVRGLHFQAPPFAQGKLVRVISGKVLDVAVDIRKDSATYGKSVVVELSAENRRQFWIPEGFAHGFVCLEEGTIFQYKCTNYYHQPSEESLLWNDPELNIDWGISDKSAILSVKDAEAPNFNDFKSPF